MLPAVRLDEFLALHEHAAGAAAGVVDAALVGREHLDQHPDDTRRRVELAAVLALGAGELREEVFVDAAEDVLGAVRRSAKADVADQVDELAEPLLVEAGAGVVLGQHALERGLSRSMAHHGVVDDLADRGLRRVGLEVRPARLLRHPEDVLGAVFVGSSGSAPRRPALIELGVLAPRRRRRCT